MSTFRRWAGRRLATALVVAGMSMVGSVAVAAPAGAQSPGDVRGLERADSLARLGRAEEARVELSAWWAQSLADASRRDVQRALWLRGILTVDPAQAALDLQRLVVEYPGGPFTDEAMLRLAELAVARGEIARAARWYRSLTRDHSGSPASLEASSWLERNASAVAAAEAEAAARASASASERAAITTAAGREDATAEAIDVDTAATSAEPPVSAQPEATGDFTVQLGAFSEEGRASQLAERLRESGFEPRVVRVRGSNLVRVRVGRFDEAEPATRLYDRLVAMGYEAVVAADAGREEPVG